MADKREPHANRQPYDDNAFYVEPYDDVDDANVYNDSDDANAGGYSDDAYNENAPRMTARERMERERVKQEQDRRSMTLFAVVISLALIFLTIATVFIMNVIKSDDSDVGNIQAPPSATMPKSESSAAPSLNDSNDSSNSQNTSKPKETIDFKEPELQYYDPANESVIGSGDKVVKDKALHDHIYDSLMRALNDASKENDIEGESTDSFRQLANDAFYGDGGAAAVLVEASHEGWQLKPENVKVYESNPDEQPKFSAVFVDSSGKPVYIMSGWYDAMIDAFKVTYKGSLA